jgi:hypothetical protein
LREIDALFKYTYSMRRAITVTVFLMLFKR